jgi:hypothetical protein
MNGRGKCTHYELNLQHRTYSYFKTAAYKEVRFPINNHFFLSLLRFGWFLPERFAVVAPPIKDHWRALTTEAVAGMFSPSDDDREFIEARMRMEDGDG